MDRHPEWRDREPFRSILADDRARLATIGEKGVAYAAKVLACTTLDLLEDSQYLNTARADFGKRMEARKYVTLIPEGQKAPKSIR